MHEGVHLLFIIVGGANGQTNLFARQARYHRFYPFA